VGAVLEACTDGACCVLRAQRLEPGFALRLHT
jgi:hypothetical protein